MDVTRRSMLKWSGAGVAAAGFAAVIPAGSAEAAAVPNAGSVTAAAAPSAATQAAVKQAKQLVAEMTLDEKIAYCHGIPATKGFTGHIPANERLGIPALRLADGPSGVGNGSTGVTQWPDSKALAATWNPATATDYGKAYGAEQAAKGHNVALAPCINLLRLPHWGRSFETYTEDPFLNGQLAAATIRGIQANHVISTVKHFVANNQEILRNSIDVVVSPRALQELYYPGFRAAVQQGQVGAVMTSYNKINGTWAQENRVNVQDTLRDAWGFDGMVMSDWGGTHSTVQTAKAGSDTEMPGSTYLGDALKAAVQSGSVSEAQLDTMVTQVLTAMIRVGLFDHPLPDPATVVDTVVSTPAHLALARRIGVEGSVLLKNDGVLPLARPRSIAVIGNAADAGAQTHGGGSGSVNPNGAVVTPLAGIRARAGSTPVTYSPGTLGIAAVPVVPAAAFGAGLTATYYASTDLTGAALGTETVPALNITATPAAVAGQTDGWSARYTGTFHADETAGYRFSLGVGGLTTLSIDGKEVLTALPGREAVQNALVDLTAGEHTVEVTYVSAAPVGGRAPRTSLVLGAQAGYDKLHQAAAAAARAADVAVVVVADVTSEGMDRSTLALPADQNELITAVAQANPNTVVVLNTSGAVLMPWLGSVKAVLANWYAGQEQGNALAAMLFGDEEPGGRLPETFPAANDQGPAKTTVEFPGDGVQVYYDEGLAVGYRWYEHSGEKPLFPFGFGLSYTSFRLGGLRLSRTAGGLRAQATVTNTGRRAGSEVVQLYVAAPDAAREPAQQLKAFTKVTLKPGQTTTVTLEVARDDLAVWLDSTTGWTVVPGSYTVGVGTSSADLPLRGRLSLS
ncbi:glycoside hydrolase family 3 C-terminal domain-containing protein [Amycolatopsis sp. FDAARGOS 1241]|uniref:glycoside hydrolase family 3 C-terminal domain-containing protein n=1 Tax=Amycolatopsis sp. FDAARGOS 1241 TaxID=2778070 RepID=UPI00195073F1|nr:glycoside hydrolase family 3 C-terminal domain-containing protein [Amycolatopsis sp. FDAARGOS 1241]QRP48469.1 glycoside hydrolase family 3 C-terminal domain-containing protein [Amycolatopsis sp. FDAARGOS 1241]